MCSNHERRYPVCCAVPGEGIHRSAERHKNKGRTAHQQLEDRQHRGVITAGDSIFGQAADRLRDCQIQNQSEDDAGYAHNKEGNTPAEEFV